MCGIAGIVNKTSGHAPPSLDTLKLMIGAIRHRGPDEFGIYRDTTAGMAHARLSIIDVACGQQPMTNEDHSLWIVFNGEIFNYVELRDELKSKGYVFRTQSDTEVILSAFQEWGTDCLTKFNGQWAFAIWDTRRKKLILSRDRVGVRPLYILHHEGQIRFASEVKAFFADPSVRREINPQGLDQVFTYWAPIAPVTIFDGIEELPAGTFRVYTNDGKVETHKYWQPAFKPSQTYAHPSKSSLKENAEILLDKLRTATRLRMVRADVPVGSYLSGGLDSSLTACLALEAARGKFRTFSIRFEDDEFDEGKYQKLMVSHLDSSHEEIVVSGSDISDSFPAVIWHAERPILRTAPAPLFLLSKAVHDSGIKAVLTGEGADEMLAGYDIFREAKIREFWAHEPGSKTRPLLFDRIYPYLKRSPQLTKNLSLEFWKKGLGNVGSPGFSHEPRWTTTSALKKFFSKDVTSSLGLQPAPDVLKELPPEFHRWESLAQAQYLEIRTLLTGYILSSQGDRMLMAHSVEGRFPFLDSEVMEFSSGIPAFHRLAFLDEKSVLKRAAQNIVPEAIRNRKKQPVRAPDAAAFLGRSLPPYLDDLFSTESIQRSGLFDAERVSKFISKCLANRGTGMKDFPLSNTDNMAFVGLLSSMLLWRQFVSETPAQPGREMIFTTFVDRVTTQPA